jgi:hypothetical protein
MVVHVLGVFGLRDVLDNDIHTGRIFPNMLVELSRANTGR